MVDPREYDGRSFINKYLKSVAFEIRFPANARIIKEFYKYQEIINDKYPEYGEDLTFVGLPDNLQPPETLRTITLIGRNNKDKVKISVNKFIFTSTDYSNYNTFKTEIIRLFNIFQSIFNIESCQRMGLRYVNVYSLYENLNESIQKTSELFYPLYDTDKFNDNNIYLYNIEVRKRIEDKLIITLRAQFQHNNAKNKYFHVLDFDTYTYGEFPIQNCEDNLDELHRIERDEFLLSVSTDFIDEMDFL